MTDIHKIFQEIEEKSKHGDYIYRGEPKCYENVSSRLWRKFAKYSEGCSVEKVQNELFDGIKKHIATSGVKKEDILSEVQHYGGDTNLIDFTTNYLIALFFACEQKADENGRVILQERDRKTGMIVEPNILQHHSNSQHRIAVQKSVFVQHPYGFFVPENQNVVTIYACEKQHIISYLEKYHNISFATVYNDLHGYIKYQDFHGGGYTQFYAGLASFNEGKYAMAVEHFTQAIERNYATIKDAYFFRGRAYAELSKYDKSIDDYNAAYEYMRDDPGLPGLYQYRSLAYLAKSNFDAALKDSNSSIELDSQQDVVYMIRGFIYHKGENDRKLALRDYDESIRLNPEGSGAYQFRGLLHHQIYEDTKNSEYWNKAFEDFYKAATIDPSTKVDMPEEMKRALNLTQSLKKSVAGRDITGRRISTEEDTER